MIKDRPESKMNAKKTLFVLAGFLTTAVKLDPTQPPSECPLQLYLLITLLSTANESIQWALNNHADMHKADSITVKVHHNVCRDEEAAGVCRLDTSQQCSTHTHTQIKTIISAFCDLPSADVRMDANTAHPRLIISDDMKSVRHNRCVCVLFRWSERAVCEQVWCGDQHQLLPDNQERFDRVVCVLGRDLISSGKHYWEVRRWPHNNLPI